MFQSLRQSNIFYILQKGENPELKVGQVVSVSNPQPKYGQYVPGQTYGQNMETVVDVSVKVGEETIDFKQLPANLSIANFGANGVVYKRQEWSCCIGKPGSNECRGGIHVENKPRSNRKCTLSREGNFLL